MWQQLRDQMCSVSGLFSWDLHDLGRQSDHLLLDRFATGHPAGSGRVRRCTRNAGRGAGLAIARYRSSKTLSRSPEPSQGWTAADPCCRSSIKDYPASTPGCTQLTPASYLRPRPSTAASSQDVMRAGRAGAWRRSGQHAEAASPIAGSAFSSDLTPPMSPSRCEQHLQHGTVQNPGIAQRRRLQHLCVKSDEPVRVDSADSAAGGSIEGGLKVRAERASTGLTPRPRCDHGRIGLALPISSCSSSWAWSTSSAPRPGTQSALSRET